MATNSKSDTAVASGTSGIDVAHLNTLLKFVETETSFTDNRKYSSSDPNARNYVVDISRAKSTYNRLETTDRLEELKLKLPPDTFGSFGPASRLKTLEGGTPISMEVALALRKLVTGTTVHKLTQDWMKLGLMFQNESGPFAYGLYTQKNGSKGFLLCIQAFVIKYLLFQQSRDLDAPLDMGLLQPTTWKRRDALVDALSEIIWRAGAKTRCYLALIQDTRCFDLPFGYRQDSISEYLHLFEFTNFQELRKCVKTYISYFEFESSHGALLFLYSVVLSRGIEQVQEDMGDMKYKQLITDQEDTSIPLVNLILTGRAVPFQHNGDQIYDDDGKVLEIPEKGIQERSDVGFLYWHRDKKEQHIRAMVGSMYKTPRFPVWITLVNGLYGLLFSLNSHLVSDWRVEHKFDLYYYTGQATQTKPTRLSVETRLGRSSHARTALQKSEEEKKIPPLERCIMTKWFGAQIDWNGTMPYIT